MLIYATVNICKNKLGRSIQNRNRQTQNVKNIDYALLKRIHQWSLQVEKSHRRLNLHHTQEKPIDFSSNRRMVFGLNSSLRCSRQQICMKAKNAHEKTSFNKWIISLESVSVQCVQWPTTEHTALTLMQARLADPVQFTMENATYLARSRVNSVHHWFIPIVDSVIAHALSSNSKIGIHVAYLPYIQ